MRKVKKSFNLFMILLFSVSVISVTSCGWKPSEEEIKQLEETKSAALAAEKTLADKKSERQELEAKVSAKKAELEKVKAEKEKVAKAVEERAAMSTGE